MTVRLQKFLSEAGVASRREGEKLILSGKIAVDGQVVRLLGTKV
ncbi:MAG: S4 domain-containing protein, partial [Limisphaerales bacterium]